MKNLGDKLVEVKLKKPYNYYGAEKLKDDKIKIREDMISSFVKGGYIDPPKDWKAPQNKNSKKAKKKMLR